MAKVTIDFDDANLRAKLRKIPQHVDKKVGQVFQYEAAYTTGYLKAKAPWTDRTGAARAGLFAVANHLGPGVHELLMAYSVFYGIWLEVANSGRYAVIGPALPVIADKIMKDLKGLLDGLGEL